MRVVMVDTDLRHAMMRIICRVYMIRRRVGPEVHEDLQVIEDQVLKMDRALSGSTKLMETNNGDDQAA